MRQSGNIFLLATLFVFAGLTHFVIPGPYASIVPPWVPNHLGLVYVSGALEIVGGIALLVPALRRPAGICLMILLVAVFPANVQMLLNALERGASATMLAVLWLRLPLQPLLMLWLYRTAVARAPAYRDAPGNGGAPP